MRSVVLILARSCRLDTLVDASQVVRLVTSFSSDDDRFMDKSAELALQLLAHTGEPFSRWQFLPGHITCTGLVLHPSRDAFLLVHHRRLNRWLLPGGHVEAEDADIWDTARREVFEETGCSIRSSPQPPLVGIDVHGIPPKRGEPFHLHHDLVFGLRAASPEVAATEEARQVVWCDAGDWHNYDLPWSIRLCFHRGFHRGVSLGSLIR